VKEYYSMDHEIRVSCEKVVSEAKRQREKKAKRCDGRPRIRRGIGIAMNLKTAERGTATGESAYYLWLTVPKDKPVARLEEGKAIEHRTSILS
jgi:hypothetical protein